MTTQREMIFRAPVLGLHAGVISLPYRLNGTEIIERIIFPNAPYAAFPGLEAAARLLSLAAGVSYFKAFLPTRIVTEFPVAEPAARYFRKLYEQGLGEFGVENQIDVRGVFGLEASGKPGSSEVAFEPGIVVPLGGGKDSLVSTALLDEEGISYRLLSVGDAPRLDIVAATVARPHIRIKRVLAPELAAWNANGALNGHVPISAILAHVMVVAGLLEGFDRVLMSNERSADEPTRTTTDGRPVNHQYSKSSTFEQDFRSLLAEQGFQFEYRSLLRPLSEIAIARRFAELEQYHDVFSSCNRSFASRPQLARWCCACPKCRFVFLALAPFLPPFRLQGIFGRDLLADREQLDGFAALAGLGADKPFECVGEIAESRSIIAHLANDCGWRGHYIVEHLAARLDGQETLPLDAWLEPEADRELVRQLPIAA